MPTALVLGGLAGVRQRLASLAIDQRLAALSELENYGQPGLELLLQALHDQPLPLQKAAYMRLRQRSEPEIKQALRAFEVYPLFEELAQLTGHDDTVTVVAISPDGNTIVSAGADRTIRAWDVSTREEFLQIRAWATAIAISPDNRTVTIRSRNDHLKAWDLRTGQELDLEANDDSEPARLRRIPSVVTRGGKYLISGSQATIKIWNLHLGQEVCVLRGHRSLVSAIALHAKQQRLVSGSVDRTIRIWGVL